MKQQSIKIMHFLCVLGLACYEDIICTCSACKFIYNVVCIFSEKKILWALGTGKKANL